MNEILEIEKVLAEDIVMSARERFNLRIGAVVNQFFKDYEMQSETIVKETIITTEPSQNNTLYGKLLVSLENAVTEEIES